MVSIRWTLGPGLIIAVLLPERIGSAQAAGDHPERRTLIAEAERALEEGKPYRASRLLVPVVGTQTGRDQAVLLLAARAASGWRAWGTVVQLLGGEAWLDQVGGGEGRALLARARVERSEPAIDDARRALARAGPENRGERLVLLARAFDRAGRLDSAAVIFRRAAAERPQAADWLRLRAAGAAADSAERAALYRLVTLPAAVSRIRWTEALALRRSGDFPGAARAYAALGAPLAAVHMRMRTAATDSARQSIRRELIRLLATGLGATDARDAIALLDSAFAPLTAVEERALARLAADVLPERAVRGFARAATARVLTEADQLAQGSLLARLGRHRDAIGALAGIRVGELAARAEYQRARSLLALGDRVAAAGLLRRIFAGIPGSRDSATAATAGFLAADLLVDSGDEAGARRLYLEVAERYPRTPHGPRAAFQAAMIAWVAGDRFAAGREFGALADRAPEHREGAASLYWSGRALKAAGNSTGAEARWSSVLRLFPTSYYAVRAAQRLGLPPVPPIPPAVLPAPDSTLIPALQRAELLERLGLEVEARFEYERLSRLAQTSPGLRLATARAFLERGQIGRAFRLSPSGVEGVTQRFAYPLAEVPFLSEEAERAGVDPLLAAALIRQESGFEPSAISRAGARGWMQIMPSLGASLARGTGIDEWETAFLHHPEINLRFGMSHLAEVLERYGATHLALAAYNAGARPAGLWQRLPGAAEDPDVFVERIQYVETRDYVRTVLRNLAVYRAIYGGER